MARSYTRDLIATYAASCSVTLVGSQNLAAFAEAEMAGRPVDDATLAAEVAPCFVEREGRRTDVVCLACTHYPLMLPRLRALAPWPVTWIDPAPAIARRVVQLLGPGTRHRAEDDHGVLAAFTAGSCLNPALRDGLASRGIGEIAVESLPLRMQ